MAALIELANQALAEIYKGQIASFNESSIEAREANRFAHALLAEMAEWTEWPQLRTRQVLAAIPNDRPAEWLHCYALPEDFGHAMAVRRVQEAAVSLPVAGPYTFPYQDAQPLAYVVEGEKLYSNVEAATLVYNRDVLGDGELTPMMQRAFVLELAARLAGPVAKDPKLAAAKAQQAEYARQRAIAQQENVTPRYDHSYVSMAEYARAGIDV